MTCDDLDKLIHPFVDGEFVDPERGVVEAHLSACARCMQQVMAERRFRQALRQKVLEHLDPATHQAPDALRRKVTLAIGKEHRRRQLRQVMSLSAAAAVLAMIGSGVYLAWPRGHDRFVEDAARRHARALPSEITDGAHEAVEAWFGGKLDHRVAVPRFPNAQVAGARLSNVTDRPAAYISYRTPDRDGTDRTIGLFVFDDKRGDVEARPLPSIALNRRLGYNVALWRDGEIVYEMVTDLDERDIRALLHAQHQQRAGTAIPLPASAPLEVQPASLQR
jgi:anti-sigma factor RsiW